MKMTPILPKLRCDAWYSALPEEALWSIYDKARQRLPWQEVAAWAAREYSLPAAPGRSAFYDFCHRMSIERSIAVERSAGAAKIECARLARRYGGDSATADAIKARATELLAHTEDPKTAALLFTVADKLAQTAEKSAERRLRREEKARALRLAEERVALDKAKFEAAQKRLAEASSAVADERLSPEERIAKAREILGA